MKSYLRWTTCLLFVGILCGVTLLGCSGQNDRGAAESETARELVVSPDSGGSITREQTLMASFTIFVLAVFVGFELITKVPPTLHTPLMSGSNAISGITLVGAALMAANDQSGLAAFFGLLAVIMATVNVIGGFMVTDRMLGMFKRK